MRFFFYGTLMDAEVRRAVLGARAPAATEGATLEGWRRLTLDGVGYPVIVRAAGERMEGVVVRGLDGVALDRLRRYEGPDYVLATLSVRLVDSGRDLAVQAFVPRPGLRVIGRPGWDLGQWQREARPRFLARLAGRRSSARAAARGRS